MEKHFDMIDIRAKNRKEATEKVIEFLKSYNKKAIKIFKIKKRNNHFQAEVRYYDEYATPATFLSEDFKEISGEKTLLLSNKNHQ